MNVLITGAAGQLAKELILQCPESISPYALDKNELDITVNESVRDNLTTIKPEIVINTAAYTSVDQAEHESDRALKINAEGVRILAESCKDSNCRLIHISTDYVFDGSENKPYKPDSKTNPVCVYGTSKLIGENELLKILPKSSIVIRTSWLYSSHGNNFVKTILKLMQEETIVSIANDQHGNPTWANALARVIWSITEQENLHGIYHYSDAGTTTWYEFAKLIKDEALRIGLLNNTPDLIPVSTTSLNRPAKRPQYSALDCSDITDQLNIKQDNWQDNLKSMLAEMTIKKH